MPAPPEIGVDDGAAAMNPMVMLAVGLAVGLIVGFIWGRFGKKALAALSADSMKMMPMKKMPMPDEPGEGRAVRDEDNEEIDADKARSVIAGFLDNTMTPGIDDNPDAEFNPVWDYKIRKQKEKERLEFRQKMAEDAGISIDEWDEDNDVNFAGARNALATLISAGARVTGVHSAQDAKALAAKEARRKMKSIETFLSKQMDVEVAQVRKEKGKRMEANRVLDVYEKAMSTKKDRADGERGEVAISSAKSSRIQLKELLRRNPTIGGPLKKDPAVKRRKKDVPTAAADGGGGGLGDLAKLQEGMDADDLEKLLNDDDDQSEGSDEGSEFDEEAADLEA